MASIIAVALSLCTLLFGAFSLYQKADERSLTIVQQTFHQRIAILEHEINKLQIELTHIRGLEAKCEADMINLMKENVDIMRRLYLITHSDDDHPV